MLFEQFYNTFQETADIGNAKIETNFDGINDDFRKCIRELGGKTFNNGLYRVFRGDQIQQATELMKKAFPEMNDRIICFSYDWLGRNFVIDLSRIEKNNPLVLLLEPGAGEAMQIPVSIIDFHNDELVNYTNDALAVNFFNKWQRKMDLAIGHNQCVGYKVPLFLGGDDTIDNLGLIDLEVYISICGELRNKTKELPNGMTLGDITIN
ncbi:T6SS immunity protein Tdi1 domain-containing protein [uncultured Desulfobacter sp.]|uniref:T6SS immunity protein Tdi1 domain-containing protein n=1 Tax=uncultured Desulfobacter sp. TaxID=240139 RepID=UPI002AA85AC1|nr:T6SS immunity protein Tdi1 domain-containing protein [uncultured Desulfobacter sp.]